MAFRSEALNPARHDLAALDSGVPSLDAWLREQAAGAAARRVGRTFVWVDPDKDSELVVGYYTLVAHQLVRDDLPRSIGRGSPSQVPAVLLARLALDKSAQGGGRGGVLLVDALERILLATRTVAARFVVVDALDEHGAAFYAHFGFKRIPNTLRLVQKLSDVDEALRHG